MSNRVTHFEIPCDDPEKNINFFEDVFGWTFQKFGDQDYWFAKTGDDASPGINGALIKKRDPNQPVTNSIQVADIDEAANKITRSGGQVVVNKMAIPNMGWLAFFKDPDGNIHGIWEDDKTAK